jgi:hypothetical protein
MFGGGHDLYYYQSNNWYSNSSSNSSYPKIDIPAKFKAEDYEVFQVIK